MKQKTEPGKGSACLQITKVCGMGIGLPFMGEVQVCSDMGAVEDEPDQILQEIPEEKKEPHHLDLLAGVDFLMVQRDGIRGEVHAGSHQQKRNQAKGRRVSR